MMLWGSNAGSLELRRTGDGAVRLRGEFPYGRAAVLSDGGRTGRPQKEIIEPRAFAYRVNDPAEDIHLLVGHDFDTPLASKATGSLLLRDSEQALSFEATIPPAVAATTHAADALALIGAGLAVGLSPGFRIPPARTVPNAEHVTQEPNRPDRGQHAALIRHVNQALLYELSIVTRPAYPDAQVQMRNWSLADEPSDADVRRALNRWRL
jgi:HK97 family phage prohead protease